MLFISFGLLLDVILFLLGLYWCKEIFQRLPRDWHEFSNAKHKDSRFALIAIWIFTALIVLWIVGFIRGYFIP